MKSRDTGLLFKVRLKTLFYLSEKVGNLILLWSQLPLFRFVLIHISNSKIDLLKIYQVLPILNPISKSPSKKSF